MKRTKNFSLLVCILIALVAVLMSACSSGGSAPKETKPDEPALPEFKATDIIIGQKAIETNSYVIYTENDGLYVRNSTLEDGKKISDAKPDIFGFDGEYAYYILENGKKNTLNKLSAKDGTTEVIYSADKKLKLADSYSTYILCASEENGKSVIVSRDGDAIELDIAPSDIAGIYSNKVFYFEHMEDTNETGIYVSKLDELNPVLIATYNSNFDDHAMYERAIVAGEMLYYVANHNEDINGGIYRIYRMDLNTEKAEIIKTSLSGSVYLWYNGYTYGEQGNMTFESFDGNVKVSHVSVAQCNDNHVIFTTTDNKTLVAYDGKVSEAVVLTDVEANASLSAPVSYAGGKVYYNDHVPTEIIFN